jgi:hypothetical protein
MQIGEDEATLGYLFFVGESGPHTGKLSVSCYSATKASTPLERFGNTS